MFTLSSLKFSGLYAFPNRFYKLIIGSANYAGFHSAGHKYYYKFVDINIGPASALLL